MLKKVLFMVMLLTGILLCFTMLVSAEAIRVDVTEAPYSANGADQESDNAAIDAAIAAVAANPDKGTVYFPAGTYYGDGADHLVALKDEYDGITLEFAEGAKLNSNNPDQGICAFLIMGDDVTVVGDVVSEYGRIYLEGANNFKGENLITTATGLVGDIRIAAGSDGVDIDDVQSGNGFYIEGASRNITVGNVTSAFGIDIGVSDPGSDYYVDATQDTSGVLPLNIKIGDMDVSGNVIYIHNASDVHIGNITSTATGQQGMRFTQMINSEIGDFTVVDSASSLPGLEVQYVKNITFGDITTPASGNGSSVFVNAAPIENVTFGDLNIGAFGAWIGTNMTIGDINYAGNVPLAFDGICKIGNVTTTNNGNVQLQAPNLTVGDITAGGTGFVQIGAPDSLQAGTVTGTAVTIVASNAVIEKAYATAGNVWLTKAANLISAVTATTGENWRIGTLQSDNCTAENGIMLQDIADVVIDTIQVNNMNAGNYAGLTRALFISGSCGDIAIVNYFLNTTNSCASVEIGGRGEGHTNGANFLIQNAVNHNQWAAGGHGIGLQGGPWGPQNVRIYMKYTDPLNPDPQYDLTYNSLEGSWMPVNEFAITSVTKEGDSYTAILTNANQTCYTSDCIPMIAAYDSDGTLLGFFAAETPMNGILPFDMSGGSLGTTAITFTPGFEGLSDVASVRVFLWDSMSGLVPVADAGDYTAA